MLGKLRTRKRQIDTADSSMATYLKYSSLLPCSSGLASGPSGTRTHSTKTFTLNDTTKKLDPSTKGRVYIAPQPDVEMVWRPLSPASARGETVQSPERLGYLPSRKRGLTNETDPTSVDTEPYQPAPKRSSMANGISHRFVSPDISRSPRHCSIDHLALGDDPWMALLRHRHHYPSSFDTTVAANSTGDFRDIGSISFAMVGSRSASSKKNGGAYK